MAEWLRGAVGVVRVNVQQDGASCDRVAILAPGVEHQSRRQSQMIYSNRPKIQSGVSNAGIGLGQRDTMKICKHLNTQNIGVR